MLSLLPVGVFLSYDSDIIGKFDDVLIGVNGATVLGIKGAEKGTEDTPLWYTCVQNQSE